MIFVGQRLRERVRSLVGSQQFGKTELTTFSEANAHAFGVESSALPNNSGTCGDGPAKGANVFGCERIVGVVISQRFRVRGQNLVVSQRPEAFGVESAFAANEFKSTVV